MKILCGCTTRWARSCSPYYANTAIQATHDEAVQTRVHLKLMSESEEQSQKLEEFKLRREKERTKLSECMGVCVMCACVLHLSVRLWLYSYHTVNRAPQTYM